MKPGKGNLRVGIDVTVLAQPHTGIARYLGNMLTYMLPRGSDLEFFLYSAQPVSLEFGGKWQLRCQEGISGRVGSYWIQYICPHWLKEDRIDVFWGQNYLLPLRLRRPCRRVLTLHDITGLLMPWTMPLRRRLNFMLFQRQVAQSCDCLVADSKMTGQLARNCLGVEPGKVAIIPLGVDDRFSDAGKRSGLPVVDIVRERFDLDPGYLLAVSTLEPRKGHLTLFEALRQMPDAPPLVVAGGRGWRCGPIMNEMQALEAEGRVRYIGRVSDDELAEIYRAASLLVYPSFYEGFGLPVLEAMACGCPVVASWSSSLPEVGGDAVRYFRPGDSGQLAVTLTGLLGRPEELAKMKQAGLERARSFSFSHAADEMLEILRG